MDQRPDSSPAPPPAAVRASRRRWRLPLRIAAWLVVVLAGILLIGAIVFRITPVRQAVLDMVLAKARAGVPGTLTVQHATWPAPDRLELAGLLWTDAGDTLLAFQQLRLTVALWPLVHRDLVVRQLDLSGLRADVPALRAQLERKQPESTAASSGKGGRLPLRAGALASLPSLALESFRLTVERLRLNASTGLASADLAGDLDLLHGHAPRLQLTELQARESGGGWELQGGQLTCDLAVPRLAGELTGRVAPDWPFRLQITPRADDSFQLVLTRNAGEPPPVGIGTVLDGRFRREKSRVSGLDATARLLLPGTRTLFPERVSPGRAAAGPGGATTTAAAGGSLPDLARLGLDLRLGCDFEPALSGSLSATMQPNAWCESGRLALAMRPGNLDAAVDLRLHHGQLPLDGLDLRVRMPSFGAKAGDLAFAVQAQGLSLSGAGYGSWRDEPELRLAPLQLAEEAPERPGFAPADSLTGLVRRSRADSSLVVEALELRGVAGTVHLDGRWTPGRAGDFRIALAWPEPPAMLAARIGLTAARLAALRESWGRDAPYSLAMTVRLRPGGAGSELQLGGDLRLPGPRDLIALLPPGASVADLGPLAGSFTGTVATGPAGSRFDLQASLARTAWLDTARVHLTGVDGRLALDTLRLALPGLQAALSGEGGHGPWDLHGTLDLPDLELVRRFAPDLPADLQAELTAQVRLQGTSSAPQLELAATGQARGRAFQVPSLELQGSWSRELFAATAAADSGLILGSVALDSLHLAARAEKPAAGLLPARMRLAAQGPELGLCLRASLARDPGWELRADTLAVRWRERDLRSAQPFGIGLDPARRRISVDGLDLAGGLGGFLRAQGFAEPDSADLTLQAALVLPPQPPSAVWPDGFWPSRCEVNLQASGPRTVHAGIRMLGLDLGQNLDQTANLLLEGAPGAVRLVATLGDSIRSQAVLMSARAELPATLHVYPPGVVLDEGPLSLDVAWNEMPLPIPLHGSLRSAHPNQVLLLNGQASAGGTTGAPRADARLDVHLQDGTRLSHYLAGLKVQLRPDSSSARKGPAAALLTAQLQLDRDRQTQLRGDLSLPLLCALTPAVWALAGDQPVHLSLDADEFPLAELNPLLPPDVGLEGPVRFDLQANGPAADPRLDGQLTAQSVQVSLADGTRVAGRGDITIKGTGRQPVVRGKIEIQNGIIQIPETQRNLLPVEGKAILWETGPGGHVIASAKAGEPSRAAADTGSGPVSAPLATSPPVPSTPAPEAGARVAPDVDLKLTIPSGLWLRGQNLDVELAGDLQIALRASQPTLTGSLKAVQGNFSFLGRTFLVETGEVTFYGENELNPTLNLTLTTRVQALLIRVVFQGTLQKPVLQLTSDPEMSEGDIMSYLLFGTPLAQLDNEQMGLIQRRATDIVAAYGTAQLEARLSRELGVDMVSIQPTRGTEGGSSLVIGKYLSRRALVKYEQALEDRTHFYLNLEYFLSRHLKLETLYGQQSQSGLQLSWSQEY